MLRRHAKAVEAVVSATDLLLTVGTFLATHRLLDRSRLFGPIDHLGDYLPLLFFSVPAWAFLLRVNGIYQSRRTAPWGREIGALARAVSLGGLVQ